MKPRIIRPLTANVSTALALAFAMAQINSSTASAALTWDNVPAVGGATDGSGTWNISSPNWWNGTSNINWLANDTAVFGDGGSGGSGTSTVTLDSGITVGGLTFNTSSTTGSYIIAGGGNPLTFGANSTITANTKATISAALAGNVTITKAGSGILELGGGGTVNYIKSGPSTGSLFLTGGTFTTSGMNFYDFGADNNTTNGKVFQTGGTVTTSTDWDGRNKTSSYNISGGTLTVTTVNRIRGLGTFNASGNALVTFNTGDARIASDNVSGALSLNGNASVTFSSNTLLNLGNGGTSASAVINLGGGVLTAAVIHNGGGAGTTGIINFNGGTLRASGGGSGFFNANTLTTVNVHGGGAIVDSNGLNIGISQPFLGTTGNGIDAVSVSAGGSGYTTAPSVTFSGGGGTGATGYALIDTNGTVTSIVITSPGKDYTSAPGIVFGSGSATATATAALVNANGGLTKNGIGTLTLNGINTFTGDTVVNQGTLVANTQLALQYSTLNYNNQGGTFSLGNGFDFTLGGLKGAQNLSLTNIYGASNLTIGNNNTSNTYSGILSNGSLIKIGTGTQTLTGANIYTGNTSVNAGTLIIGVAGVGSVTSTVTVASGATVGGSGTITKNLILAAESSAGAKDGGKLAAGNGVGVLTATDGSVFNTGSIFAWEIDTDTGTPGRGTEYDGFNTAWVSGSGVVFQIVTSDSEGFGDNFWTTDHNWTDIFKSANGSTSLGNNWSNVFSSFTYSNGTNSLATPTNGSFTWTNGGNTLTWSAVPEPTSALAGILLGAGLIRRKRTQAAVRR